MRAGMPADRTGQRCDRGSSDDGRASRSALQELAARLEFYRELGIYDFYRRDVAATAVQRF